MQLHLVGNIALHWKMKLTALAAPHVEDITIRDQYQYRCPHFRILVIGRANAGKTTILEKVCGVEKGTKPIIIHNKEGKFNESLGQCTSYILFLLGEELEPSETHLKPSVEAS